MPEAMWNGEKVVPVVKGCRIKIVNTDSYVLILEFHDSALCTVYRWSFFQGLASDSRPNFHGHMLYGVADQSYTVSFAIYLPLCGVFSLCHVLGRETGAFVHPIRKIRLVGDPEACLLLPRYFEPDVSQCLIPSHITVSSRA